MITNRREYVHAWLKGPSGMRARAWVDVVDHKRDDVLFYWVHDTRRHIEHMPLAQFAREFEGASL